MTEMRFDHIKRRAQEEFYNTVSRGILLNSAAFLALIGQIEEQAGTGHFRPATKILDEWAEYGVRLIDKWDVRCAGKLIELFPSCVPAHWKGRRLTAWMADNTNCDWMVGLAEVQP